jgi:hypothetical protein
MHARRIPLLAGTLLIALVAPQWAYAQGGVNSFRGHSDNPNGPTVSPYLNLLNNNNQLNGIPNYQSLVRPLVDQQDAIKRQGNSLQRLQSQVNSTYNAPSGSGAGLRGTGHISHFMNYSHFYPQGR